MAQSTTILDVPTSSGQSRCVVHRKVLPSERLDDWWQWVGTKGGGWRQNEIRVFGKMHLEPRLTAWWGPAYTYANVHWEACPFPARLQALRREVEGFASASYNAVLLNGYRNGQDSMGWHRDNEPEMDTTSIASLSLGAARTFKIRHRGTKQAWDVELEHGDLLVMEHLQEEFEHSIPKRARVNEPRLNFTFRRLV